MAEYTYDIDKRVEPAWAQTESYLRELFIKPDEVLENALQSHKSEGIPAINVSPLQGASTDSLCMRWKADVCIVKLCEGALLYQLAYIHSQGGSRSLNILEIGTLAGCASLRSRT